MTHASTPTGRSYRTPRMAARSPHLEGGTLDTDLSAPVRRGDSPANTATAPSHPDNGRPTVAADRDQSANETLDTDAGRMFARCFGALGAPTHGLRPRALMRLLDNRPVDPNDPDTWTDADAHAAAVLRRHGITGMRTTRLELHAIRRLARGQAVADCAAGL